MKGCLSYMVDMLALTNPCLLLSKQILKAKLVLPPYLGSEARSLLKKVYDHCDYTDVLQS